MKKNGITLKIFNGGNELDPDSYIDTKIWINGRLAKEHELLLEEKEWSVVPGKAVEFSVLGSDFRDTYNEYQDMNKAEIITYIDYMRNQPAALDTSNHTYEKNMSQGIIKTLTWVLLFLEFFNRAFKTKSGEYKKSGWLKAIGIVGALFDLGLKLVKIKK